MLLLRSFAILAAAITSVIAKVTVIPGATPRNYTGPAPVTSKEEFFRASISTHLNNNETAVLMSSHDGYDFSANGLLPSSDSFVRSAIQAWGEHLHLVIRPDEVWFSILVQMNYYMATHSEEIRDLFVDHEGKEEILVLDYTWYLVIRRFAEEIQARVKTDWLLDWIIPAFTTSTESDYMTANVLMMGMMQEYFEYIGGIICGIPSVTLLGEKEDWEALLAKLDRLPEFGPEPAEFAARLRPILTRFVVSFDDPESEDIKEFWDTIARGIDSELCGEPYKITGWITAFFYWNTEGKAYARTPGPTSLDDIVYPVLAVDETFPVGYARVPFTMLDFMDQPKYEAHIAAGNIGKIISAGAPEGYVDAVGDREDFGKQTTIQPTSGWVLYGPSTAEESTVRLSGEMGLLTRSLRQCGTW